MGMVAQQIVLTVSLGLAAASTSLATEQHTTMAVGAFVQPRAELRVLNPPRALSISAADVRAGYVEVRSATALGVRTNSREGYAVEIRSLHPDFADVDIAYGDGVVRMTREPVRLVRRGAAPAASALTLNYRFRLQPGITPGVYPWPLDIAATPL